MLVSYGSSRIVQATKNINALRPSSFGMVKSASKKLAAIDMNPDDCIYIRNRAVSALEIHGANQNFDAFEYGELKERYATFIGCPISVDHIGTTKIGTVLDSEFVGSPDVQEELEIPLMPYDETVAALTDRCKQSSIFDHVLNYASSNKLVRGSDQKRIIEAVAKTFCNTGWVENIWAIEKEAAEAHTPGLVDGILKEKITDSSMGCFSGNTLIRLSDDTEVFIKDIKQGMQVRTHLGNIGTVTGTFKKKFDKGIYNIGITGLPKTIQATHEHPFYTIKKEQLACVLPAASGQGRARCQPNTDGNYRKKTCDKYKCQESSVLESYTPNFEKVSDLQVGDYVSYSFSDEVRPTSLSKQFFRLLGYYLADGNVTLCKGNPNTTYFHLNAAEKDYLLDIIACCESEYGKTPKVSPHAHSANGIVVQVFSAALSRDLLKYGHRLAKTKKVTEEILYAPIEHQLQLIGAFINGDGFNDKYGALYLESSSKTLINNMMWMLSRARILWACQEQFYPVKPRICGNSVVGTKPLTTWRLRIPNYATEKLSELTSKYREFTNTKVKTYNFYHQSHLFFPITDINFDKSWAGDIYNFEVSGDNSYIADNVAVHNCMVNQSVCNVCGNVATGELPEHQDFCDHIRFSKGSPVNFEGVMIVPHEINRDFYFFEDSLILPFAYGGKAGGEGADMDAKFLEQLEAQASKKVSASLKSKAYVSPTQIFNTEISPDSQGLYIEVGEMPDNVEENREEFNQQRKDFSEESQEEGMGPGDTPEGTIIIISYEGINTDAIVIEEHEDGGLVVAVDNIKKPVEITIDEIIEVKELPDDLSYKHKLDMTDVKTPEMTPEERAS